MSNITAKQIVAAPAFIETALPEAIRLVAKTNGHPVQKTIEAYRAGVPNVMRSIEELMMGAAEETAKRMNA